MVLLAGVALPDLGTIRRSRLQAAAVERQQARETHL
jgi:hypothetical protein